MLNPNYDKKQAFENQRRLLRLKRDRLDDLLAMLDKLIEGEEYMSFKEFDMSEYTNALEEFIETRSDEIIRYGGDLEKFNHVLETLKSDDPKRIEAAKMAIRQYGSIEKYTDLTGKSILPPKWAFRSASTGSMRAWAAASSAALAVMRSSHSPSLA